MLKNMKIGPRLVAAFIIVAIIASTSGIISIFTTTRIDRNYGDALTNFGFAQGDIGKAMLVISDSKRAVRDIVSCTNQKYIDNAKADLAANSEKYNTYATAVEKTLTTADTKALYAKASEAIARYRDKRQEVITMGDTTDPVQSAKAREIMMEELDPIYDEVYNAWSDIMNYKVNYGKTQSDNLTRSSNITVVFNIVLACAAMILAVLFGILISNGISRPIKNCVDRLELLSAGDLHTPVAASDAKDETGIMLRALKDTTDFINMIISEIDRELGEMARGNLDISSDIDFKGDFKALMRSIDAIVVSLNDTLGQINQASDQVSSGSDQVSSGAQALSQGATEQASSVEELAATIAEISEQVKKNAQNAQSARNESMQASEEISVSNQQMQEMIDAMSQISSKSNEIGKIIKTIEDIAFQTNILALNAAVEAARAGAAGKGFAVVADEVRNLASKSAEAAKNTTVLIEETVGAVQNGTSIADRTAQSMLAVVDSSNRVTGLVDKISAASSEQAQSIAQVTSGVDQISSVVQTNSATAEESAAASEELSGQASMLKQLVGQFRLKADAELIRDKKIVQENRVENISHRTSTSNDKY